MNKKILWLDNEPRLNSHFVSALKDSGFGIDLTKDIAAFSMKLLFGSYDLIILDTMIPTMSADERAEFSHEDTKGGLQTGLEVYRKLRSKTKIPILIFTVRPDEEIKTLFLSEDLQESRFGRKSSLRRANDFVAWIEGHFLKK